MGNIKHLCFTYFIVPIEEHLFTKPVPYETQRDWLKEAMFSNQEFTTAKGVDYAVRIKDKEQLSFEDDKNIIIGKLSRKKHTHIYEKTPDDIKEKDREDWPFVGFICDMRKKHQKLVMEYDSKVISRMNSFKKNLQEIANYKMFSHGYSVAFELLVKEKAFWKIIDSADGVYGIHFVLHSPNLFGADEEADKALKELQKIFNNNRAEFDLTNDQAKLNVPKERITSFQEYADRGGGYWKISVKKNNRRRTHSSSEQALTVTVEAEERANIETLKQVLREFLQKDNHEV